MSRSAIVIYVVPVTNACLRLHADHRMPELDSSRDALVTESFSFLLRMRNYLRETLLKVSQWSLKNTCNRPSNASLRLSPSPVGSEGIQASRETCLDNTYCKSIRCTAIHLGKLSYILFPVHMFRHLAFEF